MFAQVAVPLRLPALTYRIPEGMRLEIGDPVLIPVRKKNVDGIVLEIFSEPPEEKGFLIKDILGISESYPRVDSESLKFLQWASDYYHYPMGEVLKTFLPPNPQPPQQKIFSRTEITLDSKTKLRGKKQLELLKFLEDNSPSPLSPEFRSAANRLIELGLIRCEWIDEDKLPSVPQPQNPSFNPTADQAKALSEIRAAQEQKKFQPFLIQGITGSGKTEIYIRASMEAIKLGKSVLLVVPEIALTPQLVSRFQNRLGVPIAVLHSGISAGEKSKFWHSLNRGKIRMCIGARSAAFAPMKDLGLIIVDEEHDAALKQEDHLRYNGRDLLVMRAKQTSSVILLGSATPSLESYHNAISGRYKHILLPERATGSRLPDVTLIDKSKDSAKGLITNHLKTEMEKTLSSGGQIMLLLNRRGFSSFLLCESCGKVPECPNCSVSLTNYQRSSNLKCHYCGHTEKTPKTCPACGDENWEAGTKGTEALEDEVKTLFPGHSSIRIDRESVEKKGSLEKALLRIANKEVDIVIGTQIISKGHDFPNVSLVGVVFADSSFHIPDFRASEKSFQLFTQMAGRAGRGDRPGRVFIQTYDPKHPSIQYSLNHDFRGFSEEELKLRMHFHYPPFVRLGRILFSAPSSDLAESGANKIHRQIEGLAGQLGVELLGPAPAPISKIANRYRWNILVKSKLHAPLHTLMKKVLECSPKLIDRRVLLHIDVDPVSLM